MNCAVMDRMHTHEDSIPLVSQNKDQACGHSVLRFLATVRGYRAQDLGVPHSLSKQASAAIALHRPREDVHPRLGGGEHSAVPVVRVCDVDLHCVKDYDLVSGRRGIVSSKIGVKTYGIERFS